MEVSLRPSQCAARAHRIQLTKRSSAVCSLPTEHPDKSLPREAEMQNLPSKGNGAGRAETHGWWPVVGRRKHPSTGLGPALTQQHLGCIFCMIPNWECWSHLPSAPPHSSMGLTEDHGLCSGHRSLTDIKAVGTPGVRDVAEQCSPEPGSQQSGASCQGELLAQQEEGCTGWHCSHGLDWRCPVLGL